MRGMWERFWFRTACIGSAAISMAAVAVPASGCSVNGATLFQPSLKRFEAHPGPAQSGGSGDYWEKVPAPIVDVIKITRGAAPPGSCDDAGILRLAVRLPQSSTYHIEEFGVYFRVLEGKPPDEIFPSVPLMGHVAKNIMDLRFAWLDGAPTKQSRLNLKIEAFLVTNGLDIGPSTIFEVKD